MRYLREALFGQFEPDRFEQLEVARSSLPAVECLDEVGAGFVEP